MSFFLNEFRSRMNFVLHSHDKIDQLSLRRSRHLENDTHAPLAPGYTVGGFHVGAKIVFSLHYTKRKCHTRTRISLGLKTGMNSFRNDLYGNEISSRCHVNRYREIYGDGINSFWNESHSWYHVNSPQLFQSQSQLWKTWSVVLTFKSV